MAPFKNIRWLPQQINLHLHYNLADTFIQSNLQLLHMSEVAHLWSN